MKLRDYQAAAADAVCSKLQAHRRTLLVMATGLGKTVVFGEVARRHLERNPMSRVLVLAHREELVMQAKRTLESIVQQEVAIEMGEFRSDETTMKCRIVVSTIQTQVAGGRGRGRRMERFDAREFGLVIIDEAHHAVGDSYKTVMRHYGNAQLLGVTATPDRLDRAGLGTVFGSIAYEVGIRAGIEGGWLVPIRQRVVSVDSLDFSGCRTTAGDLNAGDLARVVEYEETLHKMVYPTIEICGDRRCLVFCASVAHAERVCEIMNRHRANCAAWVCGETPRDERRMIFADFSSGRRQFLVNVGVATEGWDDAALDGVGVEVIAMMRPTKSRALYCQCIGRATRPVPRCVDAIEESGARMQAIAASAKPAMTVLDYCGNAGRHKLMHAADAIGDTFGNEVQARARSRVETAAGDTEVDVLEALTVEELAENKRRVQEARRGIVVKATYGVQEIDPFTLTALAPDRTMAWTTGSPATAKQIALLQRLKVGIPQNLTVREAARLIDAAFGTPTPKQTAVLKRYGRDPTKFTRKTASDELRVLIGDKK